MDWKVVLVLVVAGLLIVAVIWGSVAYSKMRGRWQKAMAETERIKGELAGAKDDVRRLLALMELGRMADADLAKRLRDRLLAWSPLDKPAGKGR